MTSMKKLFTGIYKHCQCNCGKLIPFINKQGKPARFYYNHHGKGPNNYNFKGITFEDGKYELIHSPSHPYKDYKNRVRKHRLVLEQYLSKKYNMKIFILPYFDVHHIDGNTKNNNPLNLTYLHRRQHTSITFTKDMSNRKCSVCRTNRTDKEKRKNGKIYPHWYGNDNIGISCGKCYRIKFKEKKMNRKKKISII